MQQITIGYSEENDIVLKHDSVSRKHALVETLGNDQFWLQDLDSKNGVYVNNRRVKKYKVDDKDQIVLGAKLVDNVSFFNRIKKIIDHRKTNYTAEYKSIIQVMTDYQKKKNKISGASKWPIVLRICLSVFLVIVLLFNSSYIDESLRYPLIMAIGTLPIVINFFFDNKHKKQEKLDMLRIEYEELLKCPKCKTSLLQLTPVYMKARGSCINTKCHAKFEID